MGTEHEWYNYSTPEIHKWPTGADCKSAGLCLRGFESLSLDKPTQNSDAFLTLTPYPELITIPLGGDMSYTPKTTKERLLHRLKISQGHLKKVLELVEKDHYCIDVLHQLHAVERGLKSTEDLILENHLRTCASDSIKQGKSEIVITELMEIIGRTER